MPEATLLAEIADARRAVEILLTEWEQTRATQATIAAMLEEQAERLDLIHGALQEKLGKDASADWWKNGPQDDAP